MYMYIVYNGDDKWRKKLPLNDDQEMIKKSCLNLIELEIMSPYYKLS